MSESIYSREVDFKKHDYKHPTYKFSKITPYSGVVSGNATLTDGMVDTQFEIPVQVFNLSKSILAFDIDLAATADTAHWLRTDCLSPIYQIQLYTRAGTRLCDIENLDTYTQVVTKAETPHGEYMDYPTITGTGGG